MKPTKYTIKDFKKDFPNDDACLNFIFAKRYGHLKNFKKYYRVKGRKCYAHSETANQIHPLAGTIFHKSSTLLTLWFHAIFLFSQSKNGVAAKELERHLGVTYKCAWRICHQIRKLMEQGGGKLSGVVEADETYMGGKKKRGGKKTVFEQKTAVMGVVERKGLARVTKLENLSNKGIIDYVCAKIERGSNLMNDEYSVYRYVDGIYKHKTVKHSAKEYVRGEVYTNSIEGFWSQLKRSINGTYHFVSAKHLQAYLDEFAFRYSHRFSSFHAFELLLARV